MISLHSMIAIFSSDPIFISLVIVGVLLGVRSWRNGTHLAVVVVGVVATVVVVGLVSVGVLQLMAKRLAEGVWVRPPQPRPAPDFAFLAATAGVVALAIFLLIPVVGSKLERSKKRL